MRGQKRLEAVRSGFLRGWKCWDVVERDLMPVYLPVFDPKIQKIQKNQNPYITRKILKN